jgi:hypothetical protein
VEERIASTSGFSTSGRVRAIEAQQLLRAAQVGGLPDARLELNVYDLLLRRGGSVGPWISETITLRETEPPRSPKTMASLGMRPARRAWRRATPGESPGFLDLRSVAFEELDAADNVVARARLERVVPRTRSWNTAVVAPLSMHQGQTWLGLDDDDLPAAQCFHGNSEILVAPAWRLPADVATITLAREWIRTRLEREHGLTCGEVWDLGGRYHPSPGITPEVVYPMAVEVLREAPVVRALEWVPLQDAAHNLDRLRDGHLRIAALRAAHALGLLGA